MSHGKEKTFSFLVPVNQLFENFIAKIFIGFSSGEFEYCYHRPQLYLGKHADEDVFLLEPDFTILHRGKVVTILDTKFKYPFNKNGNVEIGSGDLYQLTTYAVRYNCTQLLLIYPKFLGLNNERSVLAEYIIKAPFGEISLRVIQVDIMADNLNSIVEELKCLVEPNFVLK